MNKVYCTAPWNGLTVREDGLVKTCCNGKISLGNLNQNSMSEILKGNALSKIQQTMLSGEPDIENCKSCINQETQSGLSALRQHYLKFYPTIEVNKLLLKSLDIRWNNTCNLTCMYCGPTFSSSWSNKLTTINLQPVKPYQDELLEFILKHANTVHEITLVGGEPLLMKQNYQLLKQLPLSTRINIITNLSYDLKKLPCLEDLLQRPQENIQWSISCENTDRQFEYVRNGAQWSQFEENVRLLQTHWPNNSSLLMVYSMFNAFDIKNVIQYFHQLNIKKFNFQSYFGDPNMDVFKMPKPIQQQALDILIKTVKWHFDHIHKDDYEFYQLGNVDLLQSKLSENNDPSSVTKESFFKQLDWYNQWHPNRFQDLWPHVIDLVEQHLD